MLDYLRQLNWLETLFLSVGLFVVGFAGSLILVIWVLVTLPADYFADHESGAWWPDWHPVLRWLGIIGKNLIGAALVVLGVLLSLPGVPGQGFLTILIGIMLLDFPGKRRLEHSIVRRPLVLGTINRLRARFGKSPLVLDRTETDSSQATEKK